MNGNEDNHEQYQTHLDVAFPISKAWMRLEELRQKFSNKDCANGNNGELVIFMNPVSHRHDQEISADRNKPDVEKILLLALNF